MNPCFQDPGPTNVIALNWLTCWWETKSGRLPDDFCVIEVMRYEDL